MTSFEDLLTWRESSTTSDAIRIAIAGADDEAAAADRVLGPARRVVISGAGSSYYLALVVAAVARDVLGRAVLAVPLSELILRPDGVLTERPGRAQGRGSRPE